MTQMGLRRRRPRWPRRRLLRSLRHSLPCIIICLASTIYRDRMAASRNRSSLIPIAENVKDFIFTVTDLGKGGDD